MLGNLPNALSASPHLPCATEAHLFLCGTHRRCKERRLGKASREAECRGAPFTLCKMAIVPLLMVLAPVSPGHVFCRSAVSSLFFPGKHLYLWSRLTGSGKVLWRHNSGRRQRQVYNSEASMVHKQESASQNQTNQINKTPKASPDLLYPKICPNETLLPAKVTGSLSLPSRDFLVLFNPQTLPHSSLPQSSWMGWTCEMTGSGWEEFDDTRKLCNLPLKQSKKDFLQSQPLYPRLEGSE